MNLRSTAVEWFLLSHVETPAMDVLLLREAQMLKASAVQFFVLRRRLRRQNFRVDGGFFDVGVPDPNGFSHST